MNTEPNGRILEVNGVRIYHEVRGSGPSVLFIAGATGDCGHFQQAAELLSDEFTVVTYDRRANSRASGLTGSQTGSLNDEKQQDEAVTNCDQFWQNVLGSNP